MSAEDFENLQGFNSLEILQLNNVRIPNFSKVHFPALKSLTLKRMKHLESLDGLEFSPDVDYIYINDAKKLTDLYPLSKLHRLRKLLLEDCSRLQSVINLYGHPSIKELSFIGKTRTKDNSMDLVSKSKKFAI